MENVQVQVVIYYFLLYELHISLKDQLFWKNLSATFAVSALLILDCNLKF